MQHLLVTDTPRMPLWILAVLTIPAYFTSASNSKYQNEVIRRMLFHCLLLPFHGSSQIGYWKYYFSPSLYDKSTWRDSSWELCVYFSFVCLVTSDFTMKSAWKRYWRCVLTGTWFVNSGMAAFLLEQQEIIRFLLAHYQWKAEVIS